MPLTPHQARALALHRDIDRRLARGCNGRFVSGYETIHPFVERYMNGVGDTTALDAMLAQYNYPQDHGPLTESIRSFHRAADGVAYAENEILVSAGSSPLILATMMFLRNSGTRTAAYFRPLYHTFYFFAELLDLHLLPVADEPLWDHDHVPALSDTVGALLFSDPIWFAGREVGAGAMDAVEAWQRRTGSLVVVDGTFQYLKWQDGRRRERSATFDRTRTLRLICPTKSLALHGIRFAYLLGPSPIIEELTWTCQNITGASSTFDLHAAARIMAVLSSADNNRDLVEYIAARYRELKHTGLLAGAVREPNCGYYTFGRLHRRATDLVMGADYFDLSGHDGLVRVNLLSPDIDGAHPPPARSP